MWWYQWRCCAWFHQPVKFGESWLCLAEETITKAVDRFCASLASTLSTILNGEKIYKLRSDQHREKELT